MTFDGEGLFEAAEAVAGQDLDDPHTIGLAIIAYLKATNSVIVPVEVTDAMDDAFYDAHARSEAILAPTQELWSAMIQAAQEAE